MEDFVAKIYRGSPLTWASNFLRNPEDFPDKVDINYLTNQRSAARFFLKWFVQNSTISYETMLRSMHRIAACGPRGGNYYRIPTPGGQFLVPHADSTDDHIIYESPVPGWVRETYPGAMRSDLERRRIQHPTKDIVMVTDGDVAVLAEAKVEGSEALSANDSLDFSNALSVHGSKRFYIRFKNCRVRLPVMEHSRRRFSRYAPSGSDRACLLQSCSEKIERCRTLLWHGKSRQLIDELLGYYHAAVNLMPFANINNSLFMAQVNAILRLVGLRPLPHASLDSYALILSYHCFAKVAMSNNPSLNSVKELCSAS